MVKQIKVEGYAECLKAIEENKSSTLYIMFCGTKNEAGESWCPDCVTAEPVVNNCLKYAPEDAVFLYCGVGGRDFWKDQSNVFRTNNNLKLKSVPTLLKWGKPQRLEEEQCANEELVKMLFED